MLKILSFVFFNLFLMAPTFAIEGNWENVVNCDNHSWVVDRRPNFRGSFDYQAVYRNHVLDFMLEHGFARNDDVNNKRELIYTVNSQSTGRDVSGTLSQNRGFSFDMDYSTNLYTLTFLNNYGKITDYKFNNCLFK